MTLNIHTPKSYFHNITSKTSLYLWLFILFLYRRFLSFINVILSIFHSKPPRNHINRYEKEKSPIVNYKELPEINENKVEILFDISGMYCIYQLGIMQAFFEKMDHNILKNHCIFTGISGGSASAFSMILGLSGIDSPQYWYHHLIKRIARACSHNMTGLLGNSEDELWNICYEGFRRSQDLGLQDKDLKERFRVIVTELSGFNFNMRVKDKFPSASYFADVMTASALVPYITMKRFSILVDGKKCMDGGLKFKNKDYPVDTNGRIIFTFIPQLIDHQKNVYIVDVKNEELKKRGLGTNKLIGISTIHEYDKMFQDGYLWGIQNEPKISLLMKKLLNM